MRRLSLPCGCQQHTLPDGEPFIAQHCDKHRHELPIAETCGCIVTRKVGHTHTKQCAAHAKPAPTVKPDWDDL